MPEPYAIQHDLRKEFEGRFVRRRVLVTGATGFIGGHLCAALAEIGADVLGAALADSIGQAHGPERVVPVDLTDREAARSVIEGCSPDIVFHLAGLVDTRLSPDLVLPTLMHNLVGTVHLMAALAGRPCQRVVILGSSEAPPAGQSPSSPYAASKLAVAAYAGMYRELYDLPVAVARPHLVYGPHQPAEKLVPYLIRCGLERTPPSLSSGSRVVDPVYIQDLIRALLHMATSDAALGRTLDVGTGQGLSVLELARRVLRHMGVDLQPMTAGTPELVGEASQVADLGPTRAALPWRPAWSLEAGLSETIAWYARRAGNRGPSQGAQPEAPE